MRLPALQPAVAAGKFSKDRGKGYLRSRPLQSSALPTATFDTSGPPLFGMMLARFTRGDSELHSTTNVGGAIGATWVSSLESGRPSTWPSICQGQLSGFSSHLRQCAPPGARASLANSFTAFLDPPPCPTALLNSRPLGSLSKTPKHQDVVAHPLSQSCAHVDSFPSPLSMMPITNAFLFQDATPTCTSPHLPIAHLPVRVMTMHLSELCPRSACHARSAAKASLSPPCSTR